WRLVDMGRLLLGKQAAPLVLLGTSGDVFGLTVNESFADGCRRGVTRGAGVVAKVVGGEEFARSELRLDLGGDVWRMAVLPIQYELAAVWGGIVEACLVARDPEHELEGAAA
ncbi:MAG: hypothetical protein ACRDHP_18900, partial [Ktedonobacterales bacterium]